MSYLKNELNDFIYDCVVQGYESVEELGVSAQKQILSLILKQAQSHRTHEIFVDADREGLLPDMLCQWLDGDIKPEKICEYLISIGMIFYEDEISDIFENSRMIYDETRSLRRFG